MKYKMTREDERKLFEAYDVLDKICNGYHIPAKYKDVLETLERQLDEKDKEIERLKLALGFEPTLKEQELYDKYLDFVMFANTLRNSKYWREIKEKEVSNETNIKTEE